MNQSMHSIFGDKVVAIELRKNNLAEQLFTIRALEKWLKAGIFTCVLTIMLLGMLIVISKIIGFQEPVSRADSLRASIHSGNE